MRCRAYVREKTSDRLHLKVLKWLEHVELLSCELWTKILYESEVEGRRGNSRPCARWLY